MKTYFKGGKLITPHQVLENTDLVVENGKILRLTSEQIVPEKDAEVIDVTGKYVAPGFVDIHFHGAMGVSTMDANQEAIHKISKFVAKYGVTSFLPTTWSASPEMTLSAIQNVAETPQTENGATHLGVHVEGPYLSLEHRGAQLPQLIRNPDEEEYQKWFKTGVIKLVTFAPENEGAKKFVAEGLDNDVEFSIGHSGATYEQVIEAANMGVRQATHIFNGMKGLHHRRPGTVGGVLVEDRIYAQLICDGIHIHPAVVKMLIKAKGTSRVILITDAIRGTGLDDGDYDFAGQKIIVRDGIARTPEGGLSGSTLTMDRAIRNVMAFTSLPIQDVLPMATSVPAEAMGWQDKKGSLKSGADADVIILDQDFNVLRTMVAGKFVN
jgi:N-acetylglucosamine-6-phosphate deacetylase